MTMPPKIKTRETVKDIKTREQPRLLSVQMKRALIRTRNKTAQVVDTEPYTEDFNPEETAQQTIENTATGIAHVAVSSSQNIVRYGKGVIQKRKDQPPIYEDAQSEAIRTPTEKTTIEQGRRLARKQAEIRSVRNHRKHEAPDAKPHSPSSEVGARLIPIKRSERSIKHSGRSVKTERVTVSVPESSKLVQQQMAKSAQVQYTRRKATSRATASSQRTARSIVRKIMEAARTLTASVTAGMGIAAMSVVMICLVGLLIASPFGIFFSREDSGTGYTMPDTVNILNQEFSQMIERIKQENAHDEVVMDNAGSAEMIGNWDDVLAIYAVRTTTKDDAVEVATMTEEKLEILREVFWDMNRISASTETVGNAEDGYSTVLHIAVETVSCRNIAKAYHFDSAQRKMLEELMQPEYVELFRTLTGSYQDIGLSQEEIEEIIARLPENLSEERRQVVLTAYQLLGKVDYFWGGKSYVLGWDSRWGTPMRVTSPGSSTSGTVRPFGLDCSGYVDWVFYNATNGAYTPSGGNGGTIAQKNNGTAITWADALPGDLVFYPRDTHVGIICGYNESGNPLVIHCASGWDTVVVTGKGAFTTAIRPKYDTE